MSSAGRGEEAVCSCVLVLVLAREPVRTSTDGRKLFASVFSSYVVRSGSMSVARARLRGSRAPWGKVCLNGIHVIKSYFKSGSQKFRNSLT